MAAYRKLIAASSAGVSTLTLNVPERRNAIGPQMVGELLHALGEARQDASVRVVVLTGAGKAFCAGGDFQQMTGAADGEGGVPPGDYAELLRVMMHYEKPLVAKVNGHAMGGGLGLVAASHFAIASSAAKLGTPEIDVGLFPFMIMAVLARTMPRRPLVEMMLLGRKLPADEAARLGVIGSCVAPEALDVAVAELCAKLAQKSPTATRLGLRALGAQGDLELERALPMLRDALAECLGTEDAREGLTAFLEKREPKWTGK